MIDDSPTALLWIEPRYPAAARPLIDDIARRMTGAMLASTSYNLTRGAHQCTGCGSGMSSSSYRLVGNFGLGALYTHALAVHYLAYHRDECPPEQLELIADMGWAEAEPSADALAGSWRAWDRTVQGPRVRGYR